MKIYIIIIFCCSLQCCFSQSKDVKINDTSKFKTTVDVDAIFPGGMDMFSKYVSRNITLPEIPKNAVGEIIMSYNVDIDGSLTDIKLVKNNSGKLGEEISIDATRVLKVCPKWLPASKDGKRIKWTSTIPLKFSNI